MFIDALEPVPGIREWWIIYANIFLYDGDNRNLMLFEMDSTTRCRGFSAQELALAWTLDCFFSTIKSVPLLSKSKTCQPSGQLSVCCIPSRSPRTARANDRQY